MNPDAKKKLIGAIIAAAAMIAVYYGLIDQKQADNIRSQADQTLGTGAAPQTSQNPTSAPASGTSQNPSTIAPAPPASQNSAPASGR